MILILTPYSFEPLHPRLEYLEKYLIKNGYSVTKYNLRSNNRIINKLNWLSLTFFQVVSILKSVKYIYKHRKECKIIIIQDLQYLPIAIVAKLFCKKVIYDVLDNTAELNFYSLQKRFKFFRNITLIKKFICFIEKKIAEKFCNEIIVNSKALSDYFLPVKTNLICYTSPFENQFRQLVNNELALLYLGAFTVEKGAYEIIQLLKNFPFKLFIFGNIDKNVEEILRKTSNIFLHSRISSHKLSLKLSKLFSKYRFAGLSLIRDVHYSYKTQEANKDIDYLAMGVPIIGNHRKPTEEKIIAGCGIFIEDKESIKRLSNDKKFFIQLSEQCIDYYTTHYSQSVFEKKLIEVIKKTE